jgi:3-phenylpropionate/trans-cinnamate dioxygenase ferredoxin component
MYPSHKVKNKMSTFFKACELDSLKSGEMRSMDLSGERIIVIRNGHGVYALKDECTHEEYPLSEGWVEDDCVYCAFHGAKFKISNGEALSLPAYEDVKTYPTRIVDGTVEVEIG